MNTAVMLAAAMTLNGLGPTPHPHYCLKLVREIVEIAYAVPPGTFYQHFWTHRVEENTTNEPWARDLERSLRNAGHAVTTARAGDLVFNHRVGLPYGHAGVMLSDALVLDVWPNATGPPLRLVPVWEWAPTTIIRLPEKW